MMTSPYKIEWDSHTIFYSMAELQICSGPFIVWAGGL